MDYPIVQRIFFNHILVYYCWDFAIVISFVAAIIGFGTNTLTILWLSLQGIVLYETLIQFPTNQFFQHFWSAPIIDAAIRDDFPILLMVIWIGLFLDKYQRELQREYLSR